MDDLRAALQGAGVEVWEWDLDTDRLADQDTGYAQLGYDPRGDRTHPGRMSRVDPPRDGALYDSAYERYRAGQAPMWDGVYRTVPRTAAGGTSRGAAGPSAP